jgi:glycosyltransferase involved in cell wall biosynthesis
MGQTALQALCVGETTVRVTEAMSDLGHSIPQLHRRTASPRLSIVISTLNAGRTLARCLESVAAQHFRDFELIIIDGGSSDDTAVITARYAPLIGHFQSEPDAGIYDAWNKAMRIARGEWICFLGADDKLAKDNALTSFSSNAEYPDVTLVSARVDVTNRRGAVVRSFGQSWKPATMKKYMCIAHPGAWHHRSLFDTYGTFASEYRLAGDYEFLLRCAPSVRARFIPDSLVAMELGGVSNRSYWLHVRETYRALKKTQFGGRFHSLRFLLRAVVSGAIRGSRVRRRDRH